jgi:hypothetical protein
LPPVHSLFEQHPELAMQDVPQSLGELVGHAHWLLWQVLPPVQSLFEQHAEVEMQVPLHSLVFAGQAH